MTEGMHPSAAPEPRAARKWLRSSARRFEAVDSGGFAEGVVPESIGHTELAHRSGPTPKRA
jgi:hypothetical protein